MKTDTATQGNPRCNKGGYAISELFPKSYMLMDSPKLAWMKKHGIQTKYRTDLPKHSGRWEAYVGDWETAIQNALNGHGYEGYPCESPEIQWAETEDEALTALAQYKGIRLWNEEGA